MTRDVAAPGNSLRVCAVLIDSRRSTCQYVATVVWDSRDFVDADAQARDGGIAAESTLQKYK